MNILVNLYYKVFNRLYLSMQGYDFTVHLMALTHNYKCKWAKCIN